MWFIVNATIIYSFIKIPFYLGKIITAYENKSIPYNEELNFVSCLRFCKTKDLRWKFENGSTNTIQWLRLRKLYLLNWKKKAVTPTGGNLHWCMYSIDVHTIEYIVVKYKILLCLLNLTKSRQLSNITNLNFI